MKPRGRRGVVRFAMRVIAIELVVVLSLCLLRVPAQSRSATADCGLPRGLVTTAPPGATGLEVQCGEDAVLDDATLVAADDDVVISFAFEGVTQEMMQDAIEEVYDPDVSLSDQAIALLNGQRQYFEDASTDIVDISDYDDFDFNGTIQATTDGIAIVIPSGDVSESSWGWWLRSVIVLMATVGVRVATFAFCISFAAPPASALFVSVCSAVSQGIAAFSGYMVASYFAGRAASDPQLWAEALAFGLVAALLPGAGWDLGKSWMSKALPGTAVRVGKALKDMSVAIRGWAGETLSNLVESAGEKWEELSNLVWDAIVREAHRRGYPIAVSSLRVMPAGDSITYGVGSSDGNGYRDGLWEGLREVTTNLDFVGSNSSGSMMDDDHNGYPGREINEIAVPAIRDASAMRPNVVTLMAGTNDIQRDQDVANAPARLSNLIDQVLEGSPEVAIAVATLVPVVNDAPAQARRNAYNTEVRALVEGYQDRGQKVMLAEMGPMTDAMMYDRLHPNDAGYAFIAQEFAEATKAMVSRGWVEEPQGGATDPNVGDGDDSPCPVVGGGWVDRGRIATGGVTSVEGQVRFADIDGNGLTDYLLLKDSGAVDAWTKITGGWENRGRIAPGTGNPGSKVRFADIDGDHDDDYLVVHDNGAVDAWRNDGVYVNGPSGWYSLGRIAAGTGNPGSKVHFADLDGDLDDDYLVMHDNGSVDAWRNDNVDQVGGSGWKSLGQVAEGTGNPASKVRFADLDGDKDADYLVVHDNGSADFWRNDNVDEVGGSGWKTRGQIAKGTPLGGGSKVQFADVDGDRDADYLVIGEGGEVSLWQNNDVADVGGSGWTEKGLHVRDLNVSGTVRFADLDGDKDADYLVVGPGGVVDAWRNDNVAEVGGQGWHYLSRIAKGVSMSSSERVAFADYDGDGDDDYLVVSNNSGAVRAWRNDGVFASGGSAWKEVGRIAYGTPDEGEVQFADLDGDGDDDYLVVAWDHSVTAWRNDGTNAPGGGGWTSKGLIARPTASINEKTMFANLTCDRRADYVLRDPTQNNKLTGWTNLNGFENQWAAPKKVAWGVYVSYDPVIHLADLSGDGFDDYLIVDPRSGATEAWLNAGGNQATP